MLDHLKYKTKTEIEMIEFLGTNENFDSKNGYTKVHPIIEKQLINNIFDLNMLDENIMECSGEKYPYTFSSDEWKKFTQNKIETRLFMIRKGFINNIKSEYPHNIYKFKNKNLIEFYLIEAPILSVLNIF